MDKAGALNKLTAYRRDIHKYAESGWAEFRTTAKIAEALKDSSYNIRFGGELFCQEYVLGRTIDEENEKKRAAEQGADIEILKKIGAYTGLSAELDTGRPGPVTALRFDIDAVDVQEACDNGHRPAKEGFASVNAGVMHACGHDAHTAIGIVLAQLLDQEKRQLCGKVRILFQPAEEGVRGGYAMTSAGLTDDADNFIAVHLGLGLPTGTVFGASEGFLCTTKFDAYFEGESAHAGGEPERGKNALLAAASAALNLHAIAPHSEGKTRLNVGVLRAGDGRNVIPPSAYMKVETRGETQKVAAYVYNRALEVINGAGAMYGVKSSVVKMGEAPSAACSQDLAETIMEEAGTVKEVSSIRYAREVGGSDDACWMINRVQEHGGRATYMGVGSNNKAGHHNSRFDIDEESMYIALEVLKKTVETLNRFNS